MKRKIENIKSLNENELKELCSDIRATIIEQVSKNGGHLSSNLGVVELSVVLHHLFDIKENPLIFDVSHQCYAHKILTNRNLENLRQFNGISGYTEPNESEYDFFIAGHSSTSISLATGVAKAFSLNKKDAIPIAIIGDGAMGCGLAYEALNELGDRKYPSIIILNDNKMSISKPIGAVSRFLSKSLSSPIYQKFKKGVEAMLEYLPEGARYTAKRFEDGFKLITPAGMFFEELGLEYIGPIDGHNIADLITALNLAKSLKKPVLLHIQTIKGYGYEYSLNDEGSWHGVGAFDIKTGKSLSSSKKPSATAIFSDILDELASKNEKIVGLSAAMPSGTGIDKLIAKYPNRFYDVGIAEAHAVTSMAAMSKCGFMPVVAIYSTFLQRAYDSLIHDCAILNLNMVFALDRAGIVGNDGKTHQGAFDISYISCIPNFKICAPTNAKSFKLLLEYATSKVGLIAIRYPRGSFALDESYEPSLKTHFIKNVNSNISFLGFGEGVAKALAVSEEINANVIDLVFAKPLDKEFLLNLAKSSKEWHIFSESAKIGGLNSIISSFLKEYDLDIKLISYEYEDEFITHGNTNEVMQSLGLDAKSIINKIKGNK
ncbi:MULTISPECIES: 1-deoxy-D-xylulose-5-phosphate synthase [unclassified Campylobacter]|uniref:1-deoxy-D-xylulose-5-phosphate synthase n=2 Tax=Campylobacter TaxID=194 RepID=UPI001BDB6497|nr:MULTISPECIES: 1-deoxy-D-xylulose-5-phosphate synthase [unclassified Campylobacter]MBZ7979084.1 1-deoxy-D-xylulose-5-phosphate synthase [Campylobacter sp. RM12642]MBZ7983095.1 1-deoxy-D-xylulose-5-phosphate synthase [Campylobacter sp. RM12647]MBZ7993211.1 1-deoxy-D-xylulose-5-phosphate synthase [Campylobacter sp. RM9333]MBZ8006774.1 1-deoxy-D-xylulose-5-phosphate synthase [Campylobacter sp. RM9334]MBT0880921.1 1-deoxy-D-xylulose-5-phosphate synthase [Campylobacter sp. 2018MI27]